MPPAIIQRMCAAGGGWDTDGVMVTTTATPQERIVLIDTKNQNMMIYKPRNAGRVWAGRRALVQVRR